MSNAFYRAADEFCTWAGSHATDGPADVPQAVRALAGLYAAALALPADPERGKDIAEPDPATHPTWIPAVEHFAALPCRFYWVVFDPHAEPDGEPVAGDLVDDLADVYRDVATGVLLWEQGHRNEAIWHWRFNSNVHWGRHAVSALAAMHAWAADYGSWL